MGSRTKLALGLLGSALFLGLLGDELFRATPLGLNVPLWIVALCAVLVALSRWGGAPLIGTRRWMIPTLVLFAALVVWRDSTWLVALDLFAIVVALALGALRTALPLHRAGPPRHPVRPAPPGRAAGGKGGTPGQGCIHRAGRPEGPCAPPLFLGVVGPPAGGRFAPAGRQLGRMAVDMQAGH